MDFTINESDIKLIIKEYSLLTLKSQIFLTSFFTTMSITSYIISIWIKRHTFLLVGSFYLLLVICTIIMLLMNYSKIKYDKNAKFKSFSKNNIIEYTFIVEKRKFILKCLTKGNVNVIVKDDVNKIKYSHKYIYIFSDYDVLIIPKCDEVIDLINTYKEYKGDIK